MLLLLLLAAATATGLKKEEEKKNSNTLEFIARVHQLILRFCFYICFSLTNYGHLDLGQRDGN